MGTRAVLIFCGDDGAEHGVYQHWDGDPRTVAANLDKARTLAWPLPRYEADEFAAAYVAAVKTGEGNVRLMERPNADVGQSYTYVVTPERNKAGGLYLNVMVYGGLRRELALFGGATGGFRSWAASAAA